MNPDLSLLISKFNEREIEPDEIDDLYVERETARGSFEQQILGDITQGRYNRILLIGSRGSGKTSLNSYLLSHLKKNKNILPIILSTSSAPETEKKILDELLHAIRNLYEAGELQYTGQDSNPGRLLMDQQQSSQLVNNLREVINNTPGLYRMLLIIDELDKGSPRNASQILKDLEKDISSIGTKVHMLASMAPITSRKHLDSKLEAMVHRCIIPPMDKKRVIQVIEKRINSDGRDTSRNLLYSDVIDEDALDYTIELSCGMMRRVILFFRLSLEQASGNKESRISKATVEKAFDQYIEEAGGFYTATTEEEREAIEAVQSENWSQVIKRYDVLGNMIDKKAYMIETSDENRLFIVAPELKSAIKKKTTELRKLERKEIVEIRNKSSLLFLGQDSVQGMPFAIELADMTRGTAIYGSSGTGKSVLLKIITEEAAILGTNVIVFDVKGDLTELAINAKEDDKEKLNCYGLSFDDVMDLRKKANFRIIGPGSRAFERKLVLNPISVPLTVTAGKDNDGICAYIDALSEGLLDLLDIDESKYEGARGFVQLLLQYMSKKNEPRTLSRFAELAKNPPQDIEGVTTNQLFKIEELAPPATREKICRQISGLLAGTDRTLFENGDDVFNFNDFISSEEGKANVTLVYLFGLTPRRLRMILACMLYWLAYMMRDLRGTEKKPELLLCFDEVWKFTGSTSESGKPRALENALEELVRTGRFCGLGCLFASQRREDFPDGLFSQLRNGFEATLGKNEFISRIGSQTAKFVTRWLLTRHEKRVTVEEISSLGSSAGRDINALQKAFRFLSGVSHLKQVE